MSLRCPGYLNAKSLLDGGDCLEDYVEWFSSPELSSYRLLIDAVYKTIQYRGDDPVLLVCDVSSESCLIFRFTMKAQDRKGRSHQRCEVMKVGRLELPALLNGEFKAIPDEKAKEFVVDGVEGAPLPQYERHQVKDAMLGAYARNPKAYWFKSEGVTQITPPRQQPTGVSRQSIRSDRTVDVPTEGKNAMSKVWFALLIVSCAVGGWIYFQSVDEIGQLRKNIESRDGEIRDCRVRISNLRSENNRLQGEISKFDKWVRTRSNFELNKVQIKSKFDEIIQDFREAESLLAHIDEAPRPPSRERKVVIYGNSETNRAPGRAGKPHPRRDDNKGAGTATESSGQEDPKREDMEKEKGFFDAPVEKVKTLF